MKLLLAAVAAALRGNAEGHGSAAMVVSPDSLSAQVGRRCTTLWVDFKDEVSRCHAVGTAAGAPACIKASQSQ